MSASGARDGTRLHCLTHTHELGRRGADAGRACEGESGGVGECVRGRVCARESVCEGECVREWVRRCEPRGKVEQVRVCA